MAKKKVLTKELSAELDKQIENMSPEEIAVLVKEGRRLLNPSTGSRKEYFRLYQARRALAARQGIGTHEN